MKNHKNNMVKIELNDQQVDLLTELLNDIEGVDKTTDSIIDGILSALKDAYEE